MNPGDVYAHIHKKQLYAFHIILAVDKKIVTVWDSLQGPAYKTTTKDPIFHARQRITSSKPIRLQQFEIAHINLYISNATKKTSIKLPSFR